MDPDSCKLDAKLKDLLMKRKSGIERPTLLQTIYGFFRKYLFTILSSGPMPSHIAFIMDGNRRFGKKNGINQVGGHKIGFTTLISTLQYCYEMGVKYVTVYAFSIDNFKRKPDEVDSLMNIMQEKIEELLNEESIVKKYDMKINFWGNLQLLQEHVRLVAEKAMDKTAKNTGPVLSVCVAYTSTDEIMHAISASCQNDIGNISLNDLEGNLYTTNVPNPDIVIRTSGETRLSNFLLWQTTCTHLQNPSPLWPDFSFWHLVWAVLNYQRVYSFLTEVKRKCRKIH